MMLYKSSHLHVSVQVLPAVVQPNFLVNIIEVFGPCPFARPSLLIPVLLKHFTSLPTLYSFSILPRRTPIAKLSALAFGFFTQTHTWRLP